MPKSISRISLRTKGKLTGILTVAESEIIMRSHGARPMTAAERRKFARFLK